ncbi:MAG: tetratricopeptide repeat protein [Bacteroidales bacterium]
MHTLFWGDSIDRFGNKETSQLVSYFTKAYLNGDLNGQNFTEREFISAIIGLHLFEEYRPYHDEFLFTLYSMGYDQHPQSEYLLVGFIEALIERDDLFMAHSMLDQKFGIYPIDDNFKILFLYSRLYAKMGDDRCIDYLTQFFDQLPEEEESLQFFLELFQIILNEMVGGTEQFENALQLLEEIEGSKELQEDYTLISCLAFCYDKVGDYSKSIQHNNTLLDREPLDSERWFKVGRVYSQIGDLTKGLEAFDYAIALDAESPLTYYYKALLLFDFSLYSEALETTKEYLEFEPNAAEGLALLSDCYLKLNEYHNSRDYALDAYQLGDSGNRADLLLSLLNIKVGKYGAALYHLKRAVVKFNGNLSEIEEELWEGYLLSKEERFLIYYLLTLYRREAFDKFYLNIGKLVELGSGPLKELYSFEPSLEGDLFIASYIESLGESRENKNS